MNPALIKAGASLLGGILGKSKSIAPSTQSYGNVKGLMMAAEKYGINPLTLIGGGVSGGSGVPGDNSSMGAALSDAAMYLGDALAEKTDKAKLQQATAERDALQQKVIGLTIRPKVPGVFGPLTAGGSNAAPAREPAGMGGSPDLGAAPSLGANDRLAPVAGLRPLATRDPIDLRREVDNKKVPSSAGLIKIDNPNLPFSFYVPSIDGEETFGPDLVTVPMGAAYGFGAWRGRQDAYKRGDAVWHEWKRKKEATPSTYRFPQDTGYTVRKRKAPYLP
jgi:hypothetical protein